MADELVNFKQGLQENYDGIAEKDKDTLYFTTDTQKIYLGNTCYAGNQADYAQNDESASDYIKNRPCYSELTESVIVNQTFDDFSPYSAEYLNIYASATLGSMISLVEGNTYNVTLNEAQYTCVASKFSENPPILFIGNANITSSSGQEPFLLFDKIAGQPAITSIVQSSQNVKITEISTKYNKLDYRYIPESELNKVGGVEVLQWTSDKVSLAEVEYAADKLRNHGAKLRWEPLSAQIVDIAVSKDKSNVYILFSSGSMSYNEFYDEVHYNPNLCFKYSVRNNSIYTERYGHVISNIILDLGYTYVSRALDMSEDASIYLSNTSDIMKNNKSVALPQYSTSNNNQFLQIVDGVPTWVSLPVYDGSTEDVPNAERVGFNAIFNSR